MILGLRPEGNTRHARLFNVIRGLAFQAAEAIRNEAAREEGSPPPKEVSGGWLDTDGRFCRSGRLRQTYYALTSPALLGDRYGW